MDLTKPWIWSGRQIIPIHLQPRKPAWILEMCLVPISTWFVSFLFDVNEHGHLNHNSISVHHNARQNHSLLASQSSPIPRKNFGASLTVRLSFLKGVYSTEELCGGNICLLLWAPICMLKPSLGALKMNFTTDVFREPLFMPSDYHSLQGPFNWVGNSRRIRRYLTRVCCLDLAAFFTS